MVRLGRLLTPKRFFAATAVLVVLGCVVMWREQQPVPSEFMLDSLEDEAIAQVLAGPEEVPADATEPNISTIIIPSSNKVQKQNKKHKQQDPKSHNKETVDTHHEPEIKSTKSNDHEQQQISKKNNINHDYIPVADIRAETDPPPKPKETEADKTDSDEEQHEQPEKIVDVEQTDNDAKPDKTTVNDAENGAASSEVTDKTKILEDKKLSIKQQKFEHSINKLIRLYKAKKLDKGQGLPTTGTERCPFELNSDVHEDTSTIVPYIKHIRKDHFLINLSPFGPNNQLRGFRDTLLLALYLNRTIVMPPFFKHRTDPSSTRPGYLYQDPHEKMDRKKIAKLMPVITMQEFSKKCPNGLDEVYLARIASNTSEVGRLFMYEKILDMELITKPFKTGMDFMRAPTVFPAPHSHKDQIYVQMQQKSADVLYGKDNPAAHDKPCAMWLEPYRNMLLNKELDRWAKDDKLPFRNDSLGIMNRTEELIARVMLATGRSLPVTSTAKDFKHSILKAKTYVAMHWRYDKADYGIHCKKVVGGICKALETMRPHKVADKLMAAIRSKVDNAVHPLKDFVVYIAAPPKEVATIEKMRQQMLKSGVHVFHGEHLMHFLKKRHKGCPKSVYEDSIHDYVSLVEMEICSKSDFFIYSGGSSWSRNIMMERQAVRTHISDVANTLFFGD